MGAGTMVRGQYPKLLALGLHKTYNDANDTEQRAEEFQKVFNVENSTSAYEQDLKMSNYGPLVERPENTPTTYTGMIQGGDKRFIHLTYSLGVRTSKELWDDDKYGVIKQAPKALARSIRYTKEVVAWNILNQGFTSNVVTSNGMVAPKLLILVLVLATLFMLLEPILIVLRLILIYLSLLFNSRLISLSVLLIRKECRLLFVLGC
jgi:hypothetical protein